MKINIYKSILVGIGIILFDFAVYIFLGLMMMNYDDFYDESKGEYWGWETLSTLDKVVVVGLNFWHTVNFIGICYIIFRIVKRIRQQTKTSLADN